ncbi:MAG: hypothetical protein U5J62_03820 [Desulfurivibrio sp.]|nr:hypothetical protein [Desulfurivibrio sp.]
MNIFLDDDGRFRVIEHHPAYRVLNLRRGDYLAALGIGDNGEEIDNLANFPSADLNEEGADPVLEIPNPFPFRGTTFISRSWAEAKAANPASISCTPTPPISLRQSLADPAAPTAPESPPADTAPAEGGKTPDLPWQQLLNRLPRPLRLTLAATSGDPAELELLAAQACDLQYEHGQVVGLIYRQTGNRRRAVIHDHDLFETVANNPALPAAYKKAMVLRPGAQGESEIVGEYGGVGQQTHVFEYLRRNSYIPWGHYAANLADDAIRYRIADLRLADIHGLRHLYYQRSYVRLAAMLGITISQRRQPLEESQLEELRQQILAALPQAAADTLPFTATLWGWNFGYDFAGSGFRLHASHQQIHQQYALVPPPPAFSCGDQISHCCRNYLQQTGRGLFADYLTALRHNIRCDQRREPASLIVHEDPQVLLVVPKAQVSQWELQIICKERVGHIVEADSACRAALDQALLLAQRILAVLGATLVTTIEYNKRFDQPDTDQRLFYALLPKLPWSMGAFSEAQQRWICGHYPEDFAAACRQAALDFPAHLPHAET